MQKKRVVHKRTKVMDFFAGEDRLLAMCRVQLRMCGVEQAGNGCARRNCGCGWGTGGIRGAVQRGNNR